MIVTNRTKYTVVSNISYFPISAQNTELDWIIWGHFQPQWQMQRFYGVVIHSLFKSLKCHCTSQQWFCCIRAKSQCIITVSNTALTVTQLHKASRSVAVQHRKTSGIAGAIYTNKYLLLQNMTQTDDMHLRDVLHHEPQGSTWWRWFLLL